MTLALARPLSSVAIELRSCWALGRRVALTLDSCDEPRLEGHVHTVAPTDAYVVVGRKHVPLDRVLAVHRPSRLGDSTFQGGEGWSGPALRPDVHPGQAELPGIAA